MEHLEEPAFDAIEDIDARAVIEGHYSPRDLEQVFMENACGDISVEINRNSSQKYYCVKVGNDDCKWSESLINDFYIKLWEDHGEKENYLERIWK